MKWKVGDRVIITNTYLSPEEDTVTGSKGTITIIKKLKVGPNIQIQLDRPVRTPKRIAFNKKDKYRHFFFVYKEWIEESLEHKLEALME